MGGRDAPWWRGAVVYQVYLRSFFDSDGDGHGDLPGLISKLDYLQSLGVDALWLSPIHPSPNRDWGYDVSDFDGVHPDYGSIDDFNRLLDDAHGRGIRILLDEVLAHTSDEHPWFADSAARGEKDDWYVWADGRDGGPPNNWIATFGGPAWTFHEGRGQWFHHKFMPQQPKLSWVSEGGRAAALGVIDTWLGRGADGFRLDVANALVHDPALGDNAPDPTTVDGQLHRHDANVPENLDVLRQIRERAERHGEVFVFGELFEEPEISGAYLGPDDGLHSAYTFPLMLEAELGPRFVREHFATLARHPEHWPSVAFSNHDVKRVRTRFGGPDAPEALARMFLALLVSLRGTVLLYQGEELGLPQATVAPEDRRDPIRAVNRMDVGRDGARTPMPWAPGENLGFSTAKPWLPAAAEHVGLTVAEQEAEEGSTLNLTRRLIALRKAHSALKLGDIAFREADGPVLAFERTWDGQRLLCAFDMSGEGAALPGEGEALIAEAVGEAYGFRIARL